MGHGTYSAAAYASNTARKISSGTTFGYDRTVRATGKYEAHDLVNPKKKNSAGVNIRESRDSVDHPNTTNIVVGLDVTGSMASTPRKVQAKMNTLFGLLQRRAYCEDPAVAFACYGDAYSDYVPLQMTQFEADNSLEDAIDSLFLEGNGGGNGGETASLLWYYLNKHTVTDSYEKRGKKGYLFMIADEIALDLTPEQVKKFVGTDETPSAESLTVPAIVKELKEKWEVFILLLDNSSAHWQGSKKFYTDLFGKNNIVVVEDDSNLIETVGVMVGKLESDDLDDAELLEDLLEVGADVATAKRTVNALATFRPEVKNSVAKTGLKVDEDVSDVKFV